MGAWGGGAGEASTLPPPPPAPPPTSTLHCIFPTSHKNLLQAAPHQKQGSVSPCLQDEAPQPLPRSCTLLPPLGTLSPGMGLRLRVADPAKVSGLGQGQHRRAPVGGGPSRATFYPGRLSTRRRRKNGQRAQRPCWAAARCPRLRRPPALTLPPSCVDAPPSPPRHQCGGDCRSRPACRAVGGSGPAGRDAGAGSARAARPARCTAAPGGGEPACARALRGGRRVVPPSGAPPATGGRCISGKPGPTPHLRASET